MVAKIKTEVQADDADDASGFEVRAAIIDYLDTYLYIIVYMYSVHELIYFVLMDYLKFNNLLLQL